MRLSAHGGSTDFSIMIVDPRTEFMEK